MITESQISGIVTELIDQTDIFIVEIKVSQNAKIIVLLDRPGGILIDDCIRVSRGIEGRLDRDTEDFELEVSSPGLTEPFKVREQYEKYTGKEVEVILHSGENFQGVLRSFEGDRLCLLPKSKAKNKSGKKNPEDVSEKELFLKDIRITRVLLTF